MFDTAYIPVEVWIPGRTTLYGGRGVWTEKDKLFQTLNRWVEMDGMKKNVQYPREVLLS